MVFFRRMLKNSFWICTAYTLLFSIVLYTTSAYTLKKGFADKAESTMYYTASKINDYLDLSQELLGAFLVHSDIRTYSDNTVPDYQNIKDIYELLKKSIRSSIAPYYTIAVSKISDGRVISSNESMPLDFFIKSLNISEQDFYNMLSGFEQEYTKSTSFVISSDGQSDLFTLVFHSYETGPLYFFFTFNLTDTLSPSTYDTETLVVGLEKQVIYTHGNLDSKAVSQLFNEQSLSKNSVFILPQSFSTSLGTLRYAYAISTRVYLSTLNRNFAFFIFIGLLILVLGYFLSYLMTKQTYSPIKSILASINGNSLKRKDSEISYISETIQNAVKLNKALQIQLAEQNLSKEDRFIRKLLFGSLPSSDVQQGLLDFQLSKIKAPFVVAVLEYTEYNRLLEAFSKETIAWVKEEIFTLLDNNLSKLEYHKILDIDSNHFAVIAAAQPPDTLQTHLKHLLAQIESELSVTLFASIGSTVSTAAEIDRSFSDALYVNQNRIFGLQYATICTIDDIRTETGNTLYYPPEAENAIIEQTIAGNKEAVMKLMDSLLQKNFPNNVFYKELFSQVSLMITSTFQRIVAGLHKRPEDIFPDGTIIFLEMKSCTDIPSLREKFSEILDYIIADINIQKVTSDEKIANIMRDFVESNYTKDISLRELAEHLNFTQEHTSRLFKKLMGDNFKNYLSHTRYLEAKKIMDQSPTIKVKDVASLVGCNTDILSRIFTKYEGISPGEYLKKAK